MVIETVIPVVEIALQLYDLVEKVPRDIADWKLNLKLLPERLQGFEE